MINVAYSEIFYVAPNFSMTIYFRSNLVINSILSKEVYHRIFTFFIAHNPFVFYFIYIINWCNKAI